MAYKKIEAAAPLTPNKPASADPGPQTPAEDLLSQQIAVRLRTMIAADELKAGERLRERALAELLQVSRTPLREALKILRGDGLVTLLPNRGAVVTALTAEEVQEKLDVLGLIEGFAGVQACRRATETDLAEIRALHHEMLAAFERQDRANYFRLNQAIHSAIVAAAGNNTLRDVHAAINRQLLRYRYQGSLNTDTWRTAIEEHDTIVRLLAERKAEELGAFLHHHVRSTWEKIDWAQFVPSPASDRKQPPEKT
ncbi:GntR family transcriptional regulator [Telmatospirillum sp.]|uniref:GntR family transcriptional regulator n=1 Tax=Telmatospirillum sp. TaxID=2079197 RepID=UPI002851F4E9|nr:GntR family transcriptional regulator [Telmatospirillum sp.]MDR3438298.1 GntR family transcriptional regulator [Telmatospirillum sp.]